MDYAIEAGNKKRAKSPLIWAAVRMPIFFAEQAHIRRPVPAQIRGRSRATFVRAGACGAAASGRLMHPLQGSWL